MDILGLPVRIYSAPFSSLFSAPRGGPLWILSMCYLATGFWLGIVNEWRQQELGSVFTPPVASLWYYDFAVTASPFLQLLISPGSSNQSPPLPFTRRSGDSFLWLLLWDALSCLAGLLYPDNPFVKVPLPSYPIWVCHLFCTRTLVRLLVFVFLMC